MNEKQIVLYWLVAIIALFVASGCCSTRGYTDEVGARNQQLIGQIEQSIEEFGRRVDHAAELSSGITDEIERTRSLFRAYTEAVEQLRNELRELQEQAERQGNTSSKVDNNPDNSGGSGNRS